MLPSNIGGWPGLSVSGIRLVSGAPSFFAFFAKRVGAGSHRRGAHMLNVQRAKKPRKSLDGPNLVKPPLASSSRQGIHFKHKNKVSNRVTVGILNMPYYN